MLGAVAIVPSGLALPKAIADEMALPPPEPKPGDTVVLPSSQKVRARSVLCLDDIYYGGGLITLVDQNAMVVGDAYVKSMHRRIEYESINYAGSHRQHAAMLGPMLIDLTLMVQGS